MMRLGIEKIYERNKRCYFSLIYICLNQSKYINQNNLKPKSINRIGK